MVTGMQGDRATSALTATRFNDIRWVAETGSTNADALELAAMGAPEGVVVVADHQTAGRGRLSRTWEAPPGSSLLVSVLLRPALTPTDAHLVVSAMAIAAAEAVAELVALHPVLKWPNDLLVMSGARYDGRKLGGILAESVIEGDHLRAVVVGLGLNVNWPTDLPSELVDVAVAINQVVGQDVDREALLVALLGRLDLWCTRLGEPGGAVALTDRYRQLSGTIGRQVRVELPYETFDGEAIDITPEGHLLVEVQGHVDPHVVTAGDVVHLRHG